MWTEDSFLEDVETILMGGHNSNKSSDTGDSDSEFWSDSIVLMMRRTMTHRLKGIPV